MAMTKFNVGIKGIIIQDGKVLLLKGDGSPVYWDCPGGRIDDNESIDETLVRELNEELPGISDIKIHETVHCHREDGYTFGDYGLVLIWKRVSASFPEGVKISDEHTGYKWVPVSELDTDDEIGFSDMVKAIQRANELESAST